MSRSDEERMPGSCELHYTDLADRKTQGYEVVRVITPLRRSIFRVIVDANSAFVSDAG
jgi:hypothetical protein